MPAILSYVIILVINKADPMPDSQVLNSEEIGRPAVLKSNLCLLRWSKGIDTLYLVTQSYNRP